MLEADFVMDGDGAGAGHLQHNVTPSMVSENFEISRNLLYVDLSTYID